MNSAETEACLGSAAAPAAPASSDAAALRSALVRLGETLERETAALRKNRLLAMDELSDSKNRALLELSRLGRRMDGKALDSSLGAMLGEIRRKLDENLSVLKLHLEAVREIVEIISDAERDAESDGTYSTVALARPGA